MYYSKTFELAFELLLADEGGFINDPDDPGGVTNYGITQKTYESFLKISVSIDDMKNMPIDDAKEIYLTQYWNPLCLHSVEKASIAVCIFNSGVLYGVGTAANIAQRSLQNLGVNVRVDSLMGQATTSQLNAVDEQEYLRMYHKLLLARIETLIFNNAKLEKYRRGWSNRAHRLLALADKVSKTQQS